MVAKVGPIGDAYLECIMEGLSVRVLGSLWVGSNGAEVLVSGVRRRALLIRLVISAREVVTVGRLTEDVWDGAPPAGAASTLRSHVSELRRLLGGDRIDFRDGGYALVLQDGELDTAMFEAELVEARRAQADGQLERSASLFDHALARWRGDALADVAGMSWAAGEIARLQGLREAGLEQWLEVRLQFGDHLGVVPEAERAVAEFPLREGLWRTLMLGLYRSGRQGEAVRVFSRLRSVLAEELGIEPSGELRELERAVLLQSPELDWHSSEGHTGVERTMLDTGAMPTRGALAPVMVVLPQPTTRLIGRAVELLELESLSEDPFCRLITLVGPGGVGKTRLAIAHAQRRADSFADGAVFVGLAQLTDSSQVRAEIASTLARAGGGTEPNEQDLPQFLQARNLLLVLDNFEHLLSAADLVAELLEQAPRLNVLVTSRERLRLRGEHRFEVESLTTEGTDGGVAGSPAVELFLAGAQAIDRRFAADATAVGTIGEICRALDGLPLAIELAAARTAVLSIEQIAGQIAEPLSIGSGALRDLPDRHQTLTATIRWSYELLSPSAQRALRTASIFQGSFTREALDAVAETSVTRELDDLLEASLVHPASIGGRFRLLELVRAFGRDQLRATGEDAAGHVAHRRYYVRRYADVAADEFPSEPGPVAREMAPDHADVRAAIASAAETGDAESAVTLTRALQPIWMTGQLEESGTIVDRVLGAFSVSADDELCLLRMASFANSYRPSNTYWSKRRVTRAGELGHVGPQVAGLANMIAQAFARRDFAEAFALRDQLLPLIDSPELRRRTRASGLWMLAGCAYGEQDLNAACRLAEQAVTDAAGDGHPHMLTIARTMRLEVCSARDGAIKLGDLREIVDGALTLQIADVSVATLVCAARYAVNFDRPFATGLLVEAERLTAAIGGDMWPECQLRDETMQLLGLTNLTIPPEQTLAGDSTDILSRLQVWLSGRDSSERAPRAELAPLFPS
jgi:predicted ATPase/DNA-binding SARP family transcriptional activator